MNSTPKLPKPQNAFFLYRQYISERVERIYGIRNQKTISKIASRAYKKASLETKQYFNNKALELRQVYSHEMKLNERQRQIALQQLFYFIESQTNELIQQGPISDFNDFNQVIPTDNSSNVEHQMYLTQDF